MSDQRVALVTAGGSGIGRCISESLITQGWAVFICDIDPAAVSDVCEIDGIEGYVTDVSAPDEVASLFSTFRGKHERLDLLINNAGIAGPTAAVEDIDPADWQTTISTDLSGPFYVTREAVPLFKRQQFGAIVNIASTAALFGYPLRSPYAAAKWAIVGLTKTWAMELGPHNIRVNAICPGSVNGERIERVMTNDAAERGVSIDKIRATYVRQVSMRTFVDAEEIAQMVSFLADETGKRISGQIIAVDGHTEGLSNDFE